MSDFRFFNTHRTWEDWLGMLLGVLIILSPWFPTQAGHDVIDAERSVVILNTFAVGILVFFLAQLEYIALQRWEEVAAILLALWLIVSPYVFGYHGDGLLRFYHSTLGGLVLLLAVLQLWQDWDLSDQDLLKHGQQ
jgi:SPW repeat